MKTSEVAKQIVSVFHAGDTLSLTLATNSNWSPPDMPDDPRNLTHELYGIFPWWDEHMDALSAQGTQAGQAIVLRALMEAGSLDKPLSVRDWIEREQRKRGGMGHLAADLLGIKYERGITKNKEYKALLRALQRSAAPVKPGRQESHAGISSRKYRNLIADLEGAEIGNPYAPADRSARAVLAEADIEMKITGDWQISRELREGETKSSGLLSPGDEAREYADAIMANGAVFIPTMVQLFADDIGYQELLLVWSYALHLIISLPA